MSNISNVNGGNDGDLFASWQSINAGVPASPAKKLPPAQPLSAIPVRTGASAPIVKPTASGGSVNMTLRGAKLYTSTDGLFTLSFPESAEVVVGATTITLPAIIKTP